MRTKITLVISAELTSPSLVTLVRSIDDQTLPYSDFDVVFFPGQVANSSVARLDTLAKNRPNVKVHDGADGDILADVQGQFLLVIRPDQQGPRVRLLPAALEELYSAAVQMEADVLLGRCIGSTDPEVPGWLFLEDRRRLAPEWTRLATVAPCVLVRQSFLRAENISLHDDLSLLLPEVVDNLGVLGHYAGLDVEQTRALSAHPSRAKISIEDTSSNWHDGVLQVSLVGAVMGGAAVNVEELDSDTIRFSIRHAGTGEDYWLPTTADVSSASGVLTFRASTGIDILDAAMRHPLQTGVWRVSVGLYGLIGDPGLTAPVPSGAQRGAVVDGTIVSIDSSRGELGLDIGATRASLIGRVKPTEARLAETNNGSLLSIRLPAVHVRGSADILGAVIFEKFRLPARLISDGKTAYVEAHASGLSSVRPIATRFGKSPVTQTGLVLNIGETGEMKVSDAPPAPVPAAMPKKETAAGSKKETAAGPKKETARPKNKTAQQIKPKKPDSRKETPKALAARLRRRVPASLEPAVKALARNEVAKRFYRRLINR